jgi:acetyl esterase/lipase
MPGAGTHTTIVQYLGLIAKHANSPEYRNFLPDPNSNSDWTAYATPEALQSRYANLGALGPDIFYLMLDYGGGAQQFEDLAIKFAGTFSCVGKLSSEINQYVDNTLNIITRDAWQTIKDTFHNITGIMVEGLLGLLTDTNNFWFFFLPLREVDDYRENWYWADTLHYVKSGCFAQTLLDSCRELQAVEPDSQTAKCLSAYAIGYLTHYIADTIGHAYVNRIVESPWRNAWQRHHLVENFIDAYVWASWHDEGTKDEKPSTDEQRLDTMRFTPGDPDRDGAARLHYARINDLCNIGSAGIDPIVDGAISSVCEQIQSKLFDMGASSLPSAQPLDDPIFATWAQFVADAMWKTYPPDQPHPTRMGRYPTADDIAGAYGAYRIVLSLATEDDVNKPELPDVLGDLAAVLNQFISDVKKDLGSIPPPPTESGGSFSVEALWDATTAYIKWLGQVADAVLKVLEDTFDASLEAGSVVVGDSLKAGLYLLNSALYSIYIQLRMKLVMAAFSVPFNEDLVSKWGSVDLQTLWNEPSSDQPQRFPIEPVLAERDPTADAAHPFSPYRPYYKPSTMAPVVVEMPATTFPSDILKWSSPNDMLQGGGMKDDMFSADGPAPRASVQLHNPDGSKLTDLESFDGSQRFFGTIFENCEKALSFAVPYIAGTPYPGGTVLPDYNLDSDRGFAWPCWDVDYPHGDFPWNGADPYPTDTLVRVNTSFIPLIPAGLSPLKEIDWGTNPPPPVRNDLALAPNDPWGSPRSGHAWVNAVALNSVGDCQYGEVPFPAIVVNPNTDALRGLDACSSEFTNPAPPSFGLLTRDYCFAQYTSPHFLFTDPTNLSKTDDLVHVFRNLPYTGPTSPENDGRLADFLRALARSADPKMMLANAVSLRLGRPIDPVDWLEPRQLDDTSPIPVDDHLIRAMAQLAVTGRNAFDAFVTWTPDDHNLIDEFNTRFSNPAVDPAQLQQEAHWVLDQAYTALWAIRSNEPGWRAHRSELGWIAASGYDDTPHRPVNVPTAPYPQYDIEFDVPVPNPNATNQALTVTARYMIASALTFVGPNDPQRSAFGDPAPPVLQAPVGSFSPTPAPRAIPQDAPAIPPNDKIIIYIHGGGSRAEEAVDMASWLIVEGKAIGLDYTVISLDLPNSAYGASFDVSCVVGPSYDSSKLQILKFEQEYIIGFIEALERQLGNITSRIVAVMGGSLGGNMSLLMTDWYKHEHPYLQTVIAWSATAMAPSTYLDIVSAHDVANYVNHFEAEVMRAEGLTDHSSETRYIQDMYTKPLSQNLVLNIPPQPIMWYRGGYKPLGDQGWQPCKDQSIARSRFDRYEIYCQNERHWTIAIDLEQISFSFQDERAGLSVVTSPPETGLPAPHLMLVAGDQDNFFPNAIYNSTIDLYHDKKFSAHGKRSSGSTRVTAFTTSGPICSRRRSCTSCSTSMRAIHQTVWWSPLRRRQTTRWSTGERA